MNHEKFSNNLSKDQSPNFVLIFNLTANCDVLVVNDSCSCHELLLQVKYSWTNARLQILNDILKNTLLSHEKKFT